MTTETPGAVEKIQRPFQLVEASAPEFAKLLPAHVGPEKFARWSLTVLKRGLASPDDRTVKAWQQVFASEAGNLSVISALMDCASLGLEPGRTFHLVPFAGMVTGVTDYKGEVELIGNANPRAAVCAQLVHAGDVFFMMGANVPPRHEPDWFGERGPVTGGYAYVDFGGGHYSMVVRMREAPDPSDPMADSFLKHREKAKTKIVWDEWPESMRLKTLVHQLRKWVSWSPERS